MSFTQRYITATGGGAHDGTSEADAWTIAEAIAAPYAAGQCLNIKAATYANTTTSRTFSVAGSTTQPIWLRGYNTTIGDCDADPTLARPEITFSTGQMVVSGNHHILSSLNITCTARNGIVLAMSGGNSRLYRCRVINQQANSASTAIQWGTGANGSADECYFEATTTATVCAQFNIAGINATRCHIVGGVSNCGGTNIINLYRCILRNAGSDAILANVNGMTYFIRGCTIRNPGRDGIRLGAAGTATPGWSEIIDNLFAVVGGTGINQISGGDINTIVRSGNAFYSITSGNEAGFGDSPARGEISLASDPHVSTTNLALVAGSTARAVVFVPENLTTTTGYHSKGAVGHPDSSRRITIIGG